MTFSNLRTREEWLHVILHSGEITRIGQHLALVIYHMSDPATNTAKLSARDLERITGWGRTAILDHLSEIEVFIRVTWGAGRAKSLFELQGVIAQVLEEQKAVAQADTTTDSKTDTTKEAVTTQTDATVCVRENDTKAATTADTNASVRLADHNSVREADTNVQKPPMGGTIGGENYNYPSQSNSLSHVPTAEPPDWVVHADGAVDGRAFEFSALEVEALAKAYNLLEFPGDLIAADQYLARQFDRADVSPDGPERNGRLHTYLAKRNREVREMRLSLGLLKDKPARKPAQPIVPPAEPPSCWFDDDARLQVANGFKVDLLEMVGGDEDRLRAELDKAAGVVGVNTKGPNLMAKVRSRMTGQMQYRGKISNDRTEAEKQAWQLRVIEEALRESSQ